MMIMQCDYFQNSICKSCSLLPMTYEQSLGIRFAALQRLFPFVSIEDFCGVTNAAGSRIRAKLAVSGSIESPQIGFWDDQRSLVAAEQCPLHHPAINGHVEPLKQLIRDAKLVPYDVASDRGELKFAVLTWSPTHDQLMLQLVLRSRESIDRIRSFWRREQASQWKNTTVLSVNLQPVRSSQMAGEEDVAVTETQALPIRFGTTELLFGPRSFLQTNYEIAAALYAHAAEMMDIIGTHSLLDLYCGVGAFSLTSGPNVTSILGIDVSPNAIHCAMTAAAQNGRHGTTFRCLSLNESLGMELIPSDIDTILCNPPRRGLDGPSVELIRFLRPAHVLYSSCNPATLQRDAALLESEYHMLRLTPFDMFPFTHHCEVLAVLERKA